MYANSYGETLWVSQPRVHRPLMPAADYSQVYSLPHVQYYPMVGLAVASTDNGWRRKRLRVAPLHCSRCQHSLRGRRFRPSAVLEANDLLPMCAAKVAEDSDAEKCVQCLWEIKEFKKLQEIYENGNQFKR